jgi:hypothetical protein
MQGINIKQVLRYGSFFNKNHLYKKQSWFIDASS